MPRKPRVEFEGAIYHIMSRGNRQEAIFRDDRDCETFIDTLSEACCRTGWRMHAFVLMGNHYHLLLETPEANLVSGMKWLQGTYTQRFNSRHKQWGHLLQGRYKALLVDGGAGEYFSTVASYIHLNPARAKLFDLAGGVLEDYRWSSYPLYFRPEKRPEWLSVERTLGTLGLADDRSGRLQFRHVMQKRVLEIASSATPQDVDGQWANIRRGWCFGGDDFRTDMLEHIESLSGKRESFSGEEVRLHDENAAEVLLREGLRVLELDEDRLPSMPKGADEKALLAWLLRRHSSISNKWIAERLAMGRADCMSRYPKRIDETKDAQLIEMKERLREITRLRD